MFIVKIFRYFLAFVGLGNYISVIILIAFKILDLFIYEQARSLNFYQI